MTGQPLNKRADNVLAPLGSSSMRPTEIRKANYSSLVRSAGYTMRKLVPFSKRSFVVFLPLCIVCLSTELRCPAQHPKPTCDAQSVFRMAEAELKRQQYDQAEQELDRLAGCQTLPAIDRFNLGWLYGRARNFRKALSEFNSVSGDVPNTRTHQYAIALAQFELTEYNAGCRNADKKHRRAGSKRGVG